MPKYVIEREVPAAGKLSPAELRSIAKQSVSISRELDAGIVWLHSYVVDDKFYCIYESPNEALIHEHARCLGVPANVVAEVRAVVGPDTADG